MATAEQRLQYDLSVERVAKALAQRYGVDWALLAPNVRDRWRDTVAELLDYVDSTGFRGMLTPAVSDPQRRNGE